MVTASSHVSFLREAVGCGETRAYRAVRKFPVVVDLDLVILVETALASSSSSSSSCMLVDLRLERSRRGSRSPALIVLPVGPSTFRLEPTEVMTGARCLARRPDIFRTNGALSPGDGEENEDDVLLSMMAGGD